MLDLVRLKRIDQDQCKDSYAELTPTRQNATTGPCRSISWTQADSSEKANIRAPWRHPNAPMTSCGLARVAQQPGAAQRDRIEQLAKTQHDIEYEPLNNGIQRKRGHVGAIGGSRLDVSHAILLQFGDAHDARQREVRRLNELLILQAPGLERDLTDLETHSPV